MSEHTRDLSLRIKYNINNEELKRVDRDMDSVIATARDMDRAFQNNAQNTQKLETKQKELQRSLGESQNKVKELKNAQRDAIREHGAESEAVDKLNRKIEEAVRTQDKYKRELKDTERQLQRQGAIQNSIKNIQTMTRETDENVRSLKNQGRAFAAEEEQLSGLNRVMNEQNQMMVAQRQELNRLTMKYGEHDDRVKAAKAEYERLTASQNRTEDSLQRLNSRIGRTNPRLSRMSDNLGAASKRLDIYAAKLTTAGNKARAFGQDLTGSFGVATLAGGAAIGYSLKKAMDFEQGMTDTEALMSQEEWAKDGKQLTNLVKEQGAATKFSSVEAALGLQELVKAGVSTQNILNGGLKDGLNLATAGGLDLAKAAEVMSTSLNAFEDKSVTSTKAANLLAGAANASATDVEEMAYGLSQSAAVMNTVGFNLEETSTALALFAQAGLKGSDSGTSLKTMMLRLSPQTDEAAAVMNDLGIATTNTTAGYKFLVEKGLNPTGRTMGELDKLYEKLAKQELGAGASKSKLRKETERLKSASGYLSSAFFDQQGKVKPLQEVFEILNKSTKNLSREQKINALNTMFGSDAIRAASIASNEGAKGFKNMNDAMSGVTAADVAKKKMDTLKGSIEYMAGSIETLVTDLGTSLIPTFKSVAKSVESVSDWFNGLSDSTKETIAKWGLIGVAGTAVVTAIGFVSIGVGGLMLAFSKALSAGRFLTAWMSGSLATYARSTTAISAETAALRLNAAARRTVAGAGSIGAFANVGKSGVGQVGKGGLLKTGSGALSGTSKLGKGIPILGTALGVGAIAMGGTENIGANTGSLLGGIGGGALAGAAVGTVAGPIGTAIGGTIGAIGGAIGGEKFGAYLQKSIKKHWPKNSLDTTLGENVTKDTRIAIKAYEKLNTSATNELNMLAWSSEKITASNSKSLKDNYANMADSIKNSMKKKFKKTSEIISEAMMNAKLTKGEKASLIDNLEDYHSKAEKAVDKSEKKIQRILNKAKKEKRAITEEEREAIAKEQEKMRTASVKTLSKSAKEQRTILSQLKADASAISVKQAASIVKSSKKAKDGAVKEANKKYKDVIAAADVEYRDNESISKSQYDAIVAAAKKTKEDSITHAREQHEKVVEQAQKQAAGHVKEVDWSTGEMLGKWDKFQGGLAKIVNSISSRINRTLKVFGVDMKIPMWDEGGSSIKSTPKSTPSKVVNNSGNSIASFASGGYHKGGQAVVGEEGPELAYTPYGSARLVGTRGAEITNLEAGTRVLTASQTRQMMNGGLSGQMPGYAKGIGGTLKDAGNAVVKGAKKAGNYVADKATDAYDTTKDVASNVYNGAKDIASSAYDFIADPGSAIDKIINSVKFPDMMGLGKGILSKTKDAAVSFVNEKLSFFGGSGEAGGPITNSYNVYDSLFAVAKTIMSSPLGKGLSITSGHREGDTYDHGKHNAIDLSGFGKNGGYKNVAKWASRLPGVGYTIGDNTVFGRKYGDGKTPNWAKGHMNHLHVSGMSGGGSIGGNASSWTSQIQQAAKQMKVSLMPTELNGIIAQINRESSGNAGIVQSSAVNDINMRNGNPARGLLQYIPSTFKNYAVKGHGNIMSGYDQLLAFFNNSSWRSDLPYGRSGWGPKGKRRFASGGWKNVDGQVLVGEEGPELVDLPNNSHVNNNTRTNEILNKKQGNTINFSPVINIKIESDQSDSVAAQVKKAVDEAMQQAFKELGNIFDSGVAY